MGRAMLEYTKSILSKVSFDAKLFCREVEKAMRQLLPHEVEELRIWLFTYTKEKPELTQCLVYLNS